MNKEAFNQLEIQQQVDYINQGLELDSLTKVCSTIGIDRATVRKRFKSKGFELVENKYINTGNTETTTTEAGEVKAPTKKTSSQNKSNKSSDIKVLENKINSLEKQIKGILDIINTTNTSNTIDTTELKKYEGTTVSRNYRINEDIQKEFKKVCNKYTAGTDYTVTDIISLALEDFINKHK